MDVEDLRKLRGVSDPNLDRKLFGETVGDGRGPGGRILREIPNFDRKLFPNTPGDGTGPGGRILNSDLDHKYFVPGVPEGTPYDDRRLEYNYNHYYFAADGASSDP